jgi:hypothetical protein
MEEEKVAFFIKILSNLLEVASEHLSSSCPNKDKNEIVTMLIVRVIREMEGRDLL